MTEYYAFLIILPIVAFVYAAVGHGGASGYLALMALFSFAPEVMRPTALLLNLFVSGIAFYHYWRGGYFNTKLFMAFAIGSIPLSFIGGMLEVDTKIYKITLGILLLIAILRMLNIFGKEKNEVVKVSWTIGILTGAAIGFFSGLIGIGGGIILSPLILLLHWGKIKEAAAVSALFIWVNSLSGLTGQFYSGFTLDTHSWLFVMLAAIGGYFGALMGSKLVNNTYLRYLLSVVLVMAAMKLIFV